MEKRFETTLAHVFGHTCAGIGNFQPNVLAVRLRPQRDRATLRHGIDGVEHQIGQHFAQLRFVPGHRRHRVQFCLDLDGHSIRQGLILPFRLAELHTLLDQSIQIHNAGQVRVEARPVELAQAADDLRRILGRHVDGLQIFLQLGRIS